MNRLYFDHNATSFLRTSLKTRLQDLLTQDFTNASSIHQQGQAARTLVEQARRRILMSLQGVGGTLTFTSGATESNNIVLQSLTQGDVLLTSTLEHPSIREVAHDLAARGVEVRWLEHNTRGELLLDRLASALEGVTLASFMAANNELGNINDIEAIGQACYQASVPLHVDAAQVWGRWPFAIPAGVTSVTLSAHKAGGPVGIGALWTAERDQYPSLIVGGHQERGRRAGTENILWIDLMSRLTDPPENQDDNWADIGEKRDALAAGLIARGGVRNGDTQHAMPNTLNCSFPGLDAEAIVMALDLEGISISTGSACTAGSVEVSKVIAALGLDDEQTKSALRWSLGPTITHADIDHALQIVDRVLARISPR